jgi:hypothetical protein
MKAAREREQVTYKDKLIRIVEDFSTETLKAMRAWNNTFQAPKENNCQPRLLYPEKLSLKELMTTKYTLQKILKELYVQKRKTKHNQETAGKNKFH